MLRALTWWIAVTPVDLRCGIDRLLVLVQTLSGHLAADAAAYVFRNRAGNRIKVLLLDSTGVWLCVRRLHEGRFIGPRAGETFCELSAEQFEWLCAGVDWQRLHAQQSFARRV